MKIEIPKDVLDKALKSRITEWNKTIRSLESKLNSRERKIKKLQGEIEMLKSQMLDQSKGTADRIARLARGLVGEMQRAGWVSKYYECGMDHCADDDDYRDNASPREYCADE